MAIPVRLNKSLERVKCFGCGRLLCHMEIDALKPGRVIEIKCFRCNELNYRMGDMPSEPPDSSTTRA